MSDVAGRSAPASLASVTGKYDGEKRPDVSRGFGEASFAANLPDAVVILAGLVTQLGDMWFVVTGVAAVYVARRAGYAVTADPWRDCLFLLAVVLGAYSTTVMLKTAFALPRPPGASTAVPPSALPDLLGPVYASLVTGHGYGFPSGHAVKSTAVYGAAALTLTARDANRRIRVAAVVVALVCLSRVVLGVHYVVDVVAGAAVGLVFLGTMVRLNRRGPAPALGLATLLGVAAVGVAPGVKTTLAAVVAALALGAFAVTRRSPRAARAVGMLATNPAAPGDGTD